MRVLNLTRVLLLALLVVFARTAVAHVTGTGLATVDVDGSKLTYHLTVVTTELDDEAGRLIALAADGNRGAADRVGQFLRDHAKFSIAGLPCTPGRIVIRGSRAGVDKIVLELALACEKSTGILAIRDDWPEVLGAHFQTVMSVRLSNSQSVELAFGEERREASVELAGTARTGWLSFIAMGVEHILTGVDHLLFLVALLALSHGLWPIVRVVTGFTLAHSVTLSLAVLGVVDFPGRIVEPLIAATIVWVAVENLAFPGSMRWRWLIAAAFGLVHGLGFASGLTALGLPRDALVRALIGFNVGVELGQLAFVAIVMPAVVWLAKPSRIVILPRALSMAVAAMGLFWLIERVFFV